MKHLYLFRNTFNDAPLFIPMHLLWCNSIFSDRDKMKLLYLFHPYIISQKQIFYDCSHIWSLFKKIARKSCPHRYFHCNHVFHRYEIILNHYMQSIAIKRIFSDGSYYLSIPNALVNCPHHILIIMLIFNTVAIYKDWILNKTIFETYRSTSKTGSKTGNWTIDPLNDVPKDQLEKEQCSADSME